MNEGSSARCGIQLHVPGNRTHMLQPGSYPCTQPAGHDKGKNPTPHASVVRWVDVKDGKR